MKIIRGLMALAVWPCAAGARPHPTFNQDVAPILYQECAECHRDGEVAPFSLLTYEDARKRATLIATVTQMRTMPPWHADEGPVPFLHARRLSAEQIETLGQWAQDGAPGGNPSQRPTPPNFPEGWEAGRPDMVVQLPEFTVPADGADIYWCQVIPLNLPETRYVRIAEFRPTARRAVHHALMFLDSSGAARRLDAATPGPGYPCFGSPGFEPSGSLGGWTPGMTAGPFPPGTAQMIVKGSDLVMQIHYNPTGKVERDQPSVGLTFSAKPEHQIRIMGLRNRTIDIPAGAPAYEARAEATVPVDVDVVGIYPHAHYLCQTMTVEAHRPDGSVIPLVHVSDWDFKWQAVYWYQRPVPLPRGTRVEMRFVYNNSDSNARNPSHPPRRVTFGERTTDEMALLSIPVTLRNEADALPFANAMRLQALEAILKEGSIADSDGLPRLKALARFFDRNHDGKLDAAEQKSLLRFARLWLNLTSRPHWRLIRFTAVALLLLGMFGLVFLAFLGARHWRAHRA